MPDPSRNPAIRAFASSLALLLPLLLSGCIDSFANGGSQIEPEDDSARVPTELWRANLSKHRFDAIVSSLHRFAAPDGTGLSLTLHLPEGLPEGDEVPTLLQLTPYQPLRGRSSTPLGTGGVSEPWGDVVLRGAAYVEFDARGTGGSEGCLDFGGAKDREDAAAVVAWIREQPWSNGIVVTDGVSHPGMGSVVAHAAVPGLTAALAHAPVVSYYRDEWYQGAKFENQFNGPFYQAVEVAPSLYADPQSLAAQAAPCTGQTTLDFEQPDGRHGALWDERDLSRHAEQTRAPVLLTQGFVDRNVHPDHVQLYWDALPDDFPKYMVLGWWYHGWPDMEGHAAETFQAMRHRWLDATLFGIENGLWNEPRVLVEDSKGVWHEGRDWPLEPSETLMLHPTPEGALVDAPGDAGVVTYEDKVGAKRGEWAGASAVFRTEPLKEAWLVNGAPTLRLVASSSEAATKWVAYLLDEAPDGSWQRVSHGYADSHTWAGEDAWEPMEPRKPYHWTLRLMPTAVVLEPDHRLVLVIASQDSSIVPSGAERPCFDDYRGGCYLPSGIRPAETAGRAVNSVIVGPEGTSIEIAWVDPALTRKAPGPTA